MKTVLLGLLVMTALVLIGCGQPNDASPGAHSGKEGETMANITGRKVLMIIASDKFRDEELFESRDILNQAGARITVASSKVGTVTGMLGGTAQVSLDIKQADAADYDAVIFVGGSGASEYFNDPTAHKIATDAAASGKVVAAICIAPSILANAGLLEGKKSTCYVSQKANLLSKQADYTGNSVEVDGNIITADGPNSSIAFGQAVLKALQQ
ncbi:MAG: DJ-1 family protein [Actinobacteria bacterium]|nr:DJ-1 family protein [Actinomycetota bacterium]